MTNATHTSSCIKQAMAALAPAQATGAAPVLRRPTALAGSRSSAVFNLNADYTDDCPFEERHFLAVSPAMHVAMIQN
jgi:hypothetical protein